MRDRMEEFDNRDSLFSIPYDGLRERTLHCLAIELAKVVPARAYTRAIDEAKKQAVLRSMDYAAHCEASNFRWMVRWRERSA